MCNTEEDYRQLLLNSHDRPVFLLKHSTRCPISAAVHTRFEEFAAQTPDVECWQMLVIEHRELSTRIAAETGITHQSPQVILFQDGQPVWNASHRSITQNALRDAINR